MFQARKSDKMRELGRLRDVIAASLIGSNFYWTSLYSPGFDVKKGGVSAENPSYRFPLLLNQRIQIPTNKPKS
jgi:hypothetical protein